MVQINSAKIDWMERFSNLPNLVVHVDNLPLREEVAFRQIVHSWDGAVATSRSLWGRVGDFCTFNFWTASDQTGYGGSTFTYKLEDGTSLSLKGPWSSNSLSMNRYFPTCHEVTLIEDKGEFPNLGYHGWCLLQEPFERIVRELGADIAYIKEYGRDQEVTLAEARVLPAFALAIKQRGMTLQQSQDDKVERGRKGYALR